MVAEGERSWSMKLRHPHDPAILAFAIPALGTLASDPLVSAVDTAFVSRIGTDALGALGVNAGIFGLAFLLFNVLAYGTTPLIAGALGEGRREDAGRIAVAALVLGLGLGVIGTALLLGFDTAIVAAMGAEDRLVAPTLEYLRVRALAAPAVLLVTVGHGVFRGHGDASTPLRVSLLLNAINLVLDPLLIFGLGWGIAGAAWASVTAQYVGASVFVGLLLGTRREAMGIPLRLPRLGELLALARAGSALTVRTFALTFTITVTTSLATRMGEQTIAAHQVAFQLWLMFALVVDAFALAGQSLIAEHLGAGRPVVAREVADRLLVWGLGTGLLLAALVGLGWPLWPVLFDLEPDVASLLLGVLPIVALCQPLNAVVFVWDGVFIGARAFGTLAWQMVLATLVTLLALFAVWRADAGLLGVWGCMVLLMALRGLGQGIWYSRVLKRA